MVRLFFLVGLVVITTSSMAAGAERADLAKQLMKALKFDTLLESVRKDTIKMIDGEMATVINQIRASNPRITDAAMEDFKAAAQKFGNRITDSWSPSEAAKIYSTFLVEGLPEEDMYAAIEHYSRPEGQRELKVINEALSKTNNYIMGSIQKETDSAMKEFMREVDIIAKKPTKTSKSSEVTSIALSNCEKEMTEKCVIAETEGVIITVGDYLKEKKMLPDNLSEMAKTEDGKRELLETMLLREVIIKEAVIEKINEDSEVEEKMGDLLKRVIVEAYLKKHVVGGDKSVQESEFADIKSSLRKKYTFKISDRLNAIE